MRKFTPKEDKFLRDNYLKMPTKRLSKMLGRSDVVARQRLRLLGLVIPADITEKFRKESQFKPGHIPENKGKRMKRSVYNKVRHTMFKKGGQPPNTLFNGAITIRHEVMRDGKVRPYKWIRIKKGKWEMLHVHIWKKKHGIIPRGHIIIFKNKDSMDVRLSNLKMITLGQNMKRNTIHRLHPDIRKSIHLIASLKRKINRHEKQIGRPEQSSFRANGKIK